MLKKKLFITGLIAVFLNLSGCSTSKPVAAEKKKPPSEKAAEKTIEASEEIPSVPKL